MTDELLLESFIASFERFDDLTACEADPLALATSDRNRQMNRAGPVGALSR